jgi:hypothetical protein
MDAITDSLVIGRGLRDLSRHHDQSRCGHRKGPNLEHVEHVLRPSLPFPVPPTCQCQHDLTTTPQAFSSVSVMRLMVNSLRDAYTMEADFQVRNVAKLFAV